MSEIKRSFFPTLVLALALGSSAVAQMGSFISGSTARTSPLVAPDSIAAGFGTNLASATASATGPPLTTTLGNAQVTIVDSKGTKLSAPLYLVSPGQITYLIPANAALGKANVMVVSGASSFQGALEIANIAPAILTADNSGTGVPAAQVLRVTGAGVASIEAPFHTGTAPNSFVTTPINISTADKVYLMLYGTGIRRHSGNPVVATIDGIRVPVLYAGAQSQSPGLDQINIGPLPSSLAGRGEVNLVIRVDGIAANTVRIAIQ